MEALIGTSPINPSTYHSARFRKGLPNNYISLDLFQGTSAGNIRKPCFLPPIMRLKGFLAGNSVHFRSSE